MVVELIVVKNVAKSGLKVCKVDRKKFIQQRFPYQFADSQKRKKGKRG